jgi:cell division GTPase FtsZ
MKIALIGIGQAGGKIADRLLKYDINNNANFIQDCIAVNTARQDLQGLEHIPATNRILYGETMTEGGGVGADNKKGKQVMKNEVQKILQEVRNMDSLVDAYVLTAGLGGGTGSGGLPILAKNLKKAEGKNVYGLGVLPTKDEGSLYTLNAAKSLEACVQETDNLMLFDNNAWKGGKATQSEWYERVNSQIAKRFGLLFGAGEVSESSDVGESVVDASEVKNTLACGGLSTLAYAETELDDDVVNPGLIKRLTGGVDVDKADATRRIQNTVRQSIVGRLTAPADVESTERALVIVSGQQKFLTRSGMEEGRKIAEEKTDSMEVRGGDYPRSNSDKVSCVVLLSGLYNIPRVSELQAKAVEADDKIEQVRQERDGKFDDLLQNEKTEQIDSLLSKADE